MSPQAPEPMLPDYGGACIASLVPALLGRRAQPWLPASVTDASQIVLLVLDGLGWNQLQQRPSTAPAMTSMAVGPITSVVPTTTATALTSITSGLPPSGHGVVGYRVRAAGSADDGSDEVLNILRWRTASGDALERVPPVGFQDAVPFGGEAVPVMTRAEFAGTGFTTVHLGGTRMAGWRLVSTLVTEVRRALRAGEWFVYAYYDGIDRIAHEFGLEEHYDAEVVTADRLVEDLAASLPTGAALVVTADHGQVDVGARTVALDAEVLAATAMLSGEGRFRWLHLADGSAEAAEIVAARAQAAHGEVGWVRTRDRMVADGWFGGPLSDRAAARLGDVAVLAHQPVTFLDPGDPGEVRLRSRHGSLTADEMLVPLLVATP